MYRFNASNYGQARGNVQFDHRDVTLGHTLKMLMFDFDCSIPVGREQLAWAADQLVELDVGAEILIGQLNITRVS